MSAPDAKPGIMDVPPPSYQPLPAVTDDLYVVHYASGSRPDGYAPTPLIAAIVVQHVLSGHNMTFATFTEAEVAGIPRDQFLGLMPQLERDMLGAFADYALSRPRAVWVHWRMRDAIFGFDVLTQRARVHQVPSHSIPADRRFDLSHYLARRYGDEFAPHPRLWNAARRNLGAVPALLDKVSQQAAWERGEHAAVLASVTASVEAIARLFDRARTDKFISGEGGPFHGAVADSVLPAPPDPSHTVLRPARLPSSPGPPIRLHRDLFNPNRLTTRLCAILTELLRLQAFDRPSCVTVARVAKAVDGPNAKEAAFKHPVAELGRWGCVDSAVGQDGGIWLTISGQAIAESLSAK